MGILRANYIPEKLATFYTFYHSVLIHIETPED